MLFHIPGGGFRQRVIMSKLLNSDIVFILLCSIGLHTVQIMYSVHPMHVHVCVCMCLYVCIYVHMCVCMYVCIYVFMYILCMYVFMYIRTCVYMYVCM